jgi:predicted amidohydrolase YtcJ
VVIRGHTISYVGDDAGARQHQPGAPEVDLGGRVLTPAFVDAHLHAVQAGLVMTGLDLHDAASRTEVLDRLAGYAAEHPAATVILGQGWDERAWPDPRPPTRAELDRAAGDRPVYLARVDVHSAVISSAVLAGLPGLAGAAGYADDGRLTRDAHHQARDLVNRLTSDADRRDAIRRALRQAASLGVAAVHELGGPHLGPIQDLRRVRDVGADLGLGVVTYWGELASPEAIARAREFGAAGLAGDLCIDGAIGSRTAAVAQPYADAATHGARYLSDAEILEHLIECTRAGLQAGFHCIGDDAVAAAIGGLRRAAEQLGIGPIRAARHRLEHLEMVAADDVPALAELGVVASVQPAFDAWWGGPGELYDQRLGPGRARTMNPFGTLHRAGVPLALGTDAPVTPIAGWATVRAAVQHWRPDERLTVPVAFDAASRGAHWAGLVDDAGTITVGRRADLAVWDVGRADPLGAGLPELAADAPLPECAATLAGGRIVYTSDRDWIG